MGRTVAETTKRVMYRLGVQHQARMRRSKRIALVTALAVVALIGTLFAVVRIAQPPPRLTPAQLAEITYGNMSVAGRNRADLLLDRWDAALRANPGATPTLHTDLFDDPHGSPDASSFQANGTGTLTIHFTGVPGSKDHNCQFDYAGSAVETNRAVAVYVVADPGRWPGGPDVGCAYVGQLRQVTIQLAKPLGDRAVIDVVTGRLVGRQQG